MGLASFMSTFAAVLSAIVASGTIWGLGRRWYTKTLGSRRFWRHKLDDLAIWVTNEYMADLLGTPIFIDESTTDEHNEDVQPNWIDRTYLSPHAWIVTRTVGTRIQGWSVTITDPKFWWELDAPTFGQIRARLGRATFAGLGINPSGSYEVRGARMHLYAESTYFGNPGAYQTYVFMHNNAGTGRYQESSEVSVKTGAFTGSFAGRTGPVASTEQRGGTVVNTIMVLSPSFTVANTDSHEWPTVHPDRVRVLYRETIGRRRRRLHRSAARQK